MRRIDQYRVRDGRTRLDETFFNGVFGDLDRRLHAQELVEKDWKAAVGQVTTAGLKRIDDFIGPAIAEVEQLTRLGFLQARIMPGLDVVWRDGPQSLALSLETDDDRVRARHFHPSPFTVLSREADVGHYLIARTVDYRIDADDQGGVRAAVLDLDVQHVAGDPPGGAARDVWAVSASAAPPIVLAATENARAARDAATDARDTAARHRDDARAARDRSRDHADRTQRTADALRAVQADNLSTEHILVADADEMLADRLRRQEITRMLGINLLTT